MHRIKNTNSGRGRAVLSAALALGLAGTGAAALAHGKHEHGVAHLDVAVDGDTLVIQLESPLDSVLGFERRPRTEKERQQVAAVLAQLRAADALFQPSSDAQCRSEDVKLESALTEEAPGAKADAKAAADGEHLDVDATYRFRCAKPAALKALSHQLFATFPRMRTIEAQVATPQGQARQSLKRPAATLPLTR